MGDWQMLGIAWGTPGVLLDSYLGAPKVENLVAFVGTNVVPGEIRSFPSTH